MNIHLVENFETLWENKLIEWQEKYITDDDQNLVLQLYFDNPYLSKNLNASYVNGVFERIRYELNGKLNIPGAIEIFSEQAYLQGCKGLNSLQFSLDVNFLINCKLTTETIFLDRSAYKYDEESFECSFTPSLCTSPFSNASIWNQYLKGIEVFVANENSPDIVLDRKKIATIGFMRVSLVPIFYLFSSYMTYWFWTNEHGFFSILQLGLIYCAYRSIDDYFNDLDTLIFQSTTLNTALVTYGIYRFFF
jgi:hypothetical protein